MSVDVDLVRAAIILNSAHTSATTDNTSPQMRQRPHILVHFREG